MAIDDRPLLVEEWSKYLKSQKANHAAKGFELVLASLDLGPALARSVKMRRAKGRVELVGRGKDFGARVFPPAVKSVNVARSKRVEFEELTGLRPKHLDFRPIPQALPKALRQPNRIRRSDLKSRKDMGLPTNIFLPEDRFTFSDTAFPWSTCGRVDTAAGWGSGAMIGPRHLMTASHVVNWGVGNTAGWLKFTPLVFDGSEPFGHAFATTIYSWNKADGSDGINADETAFDYVVCVLDTRMGDVTGWMGSRGYFTAWDGGNFWGHVGYPSDLAGGLRPSFIGYQAMDSTFTRTIGGAIHSASNTTSTLSPASLADHTLVGGTVNLGRGSSPRRAHSNGAEPRVRTPAEAAIRYPNSSTLRGPKRHSCTGAGGIA